MKKKIVSLFFVLNLLFISILTPIDQFTRPTSAQSSGLIGHWSLDETVGFEEIDQSGRSHSGYHNNNTIRGFLGKIGWGVMFNFNNASFDNNGYLTMGDVEEFDFGPTESFSLSAWVRLNDSVHDYMAVMGKAEGNSQNGYALRYGSDGNFEMMIEASDSQNEANAVAKQDYRDGQWHHLVGIVDRVNETSSIYIDGLQRGRADISKVGNLKNDVHFNVGALDNGALSFMGIVDEPKIYNQALSVNEIRELYKKECDCSGVQFPNLTSHLIKANNSPKIYYINAKNQRRWIINETIFNLYNNKWEDVATVQPQDLEIYSDVKLMRAINDSKVYFIAGTTKKWIKTIKEFEKKGHQWEDIANVLEADLAEYNEI